MTSIKKPGFQETAVGWIPSDWSAKKLGELAHVDAESLSSKTPAEFSFRYISLGDVSSGKLINSSSEVNFSEAPSRARRIVRQGDILFATVRPNLKGHYFARHVSGNVIASTGFSVVRPRVDLAAPEFLYQALLSRKVDEQIEKLTVGSNYPAVSSADVKALCLPAPPVQEQQKIAAILTAVDDKLDLVALQIEVNQSLKRGLMQTLFSRGVGTQDADERWVPHTELKDSELGRIPASWQVRPIGSIFEVVERAIKMDEVQSYRRVTVKRRFGGIELRDEMPGAAIKVKSQFLVEEGDFLISERQIVHGACGVVPPELAGALVSNEYLVLKAKPGTDVRYFNYMVQLLRFRKYFLLCSQGVDIEKFLFKPKDWLRKLVPVPPPDEQARIADVLAVVDQKLHALEEKRSEFETLKRGLMQKLLTGEWRVKVAVEEMAA